MKFPILLGRSNKWMKKIKTLVSRGKKINKLFNN